MATHVPEGSLILVTGGSGYIGLNLIGCLLAAKYRVRALARSDSARERLEREYGNRVEIVLGDVTDLESLVGVARGVGAVVHLAALKADESNSYAVNVGGAVNLAAACGFVGVQRIINVSTMAAKLARRGLYGETKAAADEILHRSGLDVTTLYLSLVYSQDLGGAFGQLVHMVRALPLVPMIGRGSGKFWPIHVEDVATVIARCMERGDSAGKMYDIGGPDEITFAELVRTVVATLKLRRALFSLPPPLAMVVAKLTQGFLARPPITVSNVLGAIQELRFDAAPAFRDLDYKPRGFAEGVRSALNGQVKFE